ncbi:hypothetical protein MWU59_02250 [Flavobacteriaceae bacterium F08102]|nr:hypothetical protein [Flavobacteriaceae bacterium F08102]
MKNLKYIVFMLAMVVSMGVKAQKILVQGKEYKVKGEKIFLGKEDVTESLSSEERQNIKSQLAKTIALEKAAKEAKKAEKKQKKAEKEQKKAEKKQRKQEKAINNLAKSEKKLEKETSRYNKLKANGALSPQDEIKWMNKLKKLREKISKARKKVK